MHAKAVYIIHNWVMSISMESHRDAFGGCVIE